MAIRLNKNMREVLYELVEALVQDTELRKELESKRKNLEIEAHAYSENWITKEDRAVLSKFGYLEQWKGMSKSKWNPPDKRLGNLRMEFDVPVTIVYDKRHKIQEAKEVSFAYDLCWNTAQALFESEDLLQAPYKTLIRKAQTYEAVLKVWPEAEAVRDKMVPTVKIKPDTPLCEAIHADMERRGVQVKTECE